MYIKLFIRLQEQLPHKEVANPFHSLDVFYVWLMSASPRSDTGPYPVPLDELWTYLGRKKEIKKSLIINFFMDSEFRCPFYLPFFVVCCFFVVFVVLTFITDADPNIRTNFIGHSMERIT